MLAECKILTGDAAEKLAELPEQSVQCCVTSPPYYGLRDYGTAQWEGGDPACDHSTPRSRGEDIKPGDKQGTSPGSRPNLQMECKCGAKRADKQIGLERSVDDYIGRLIDVARGIRRVLRDDGTFWLNLGDSYFNYRPGCVAQGKQTIAKHEGAVVQKSGKRGLRQTGIKEKDLMGIPWSVAFALRDDGWWLRSDIIWAKPNPMPESVTDRPSRSHEYVFLLTKNKDYYYDAEAIKEPYSPETLPRQQRGVSDHHKYVDGCPGQPSVHTMNQPRLHSKYRGQATKDYELALAQNPSDTKRRIEESILNGNGMANKKSVWNVATSPYPGSHFATYPPDLIKPCIMAGSKIGDTVLDPFAGSGTTGEVALELGRSAILIELNPEYAELIRKRTHVTPGFL